MKRLATRIGEHSPVGGFVSNRNRIGKEPHGLSGREVVMHQMDNIPLHFAQSDWLIRLGGREREREVKFHLFSRVGAALTLNSVDADHTGSRCRGIGSPWASATVIRIGSALGG